MPFVVASDLRVGIARQHRRQRAGVVLLGVMGDDEVDLRDVRELRQEHVDLRRVDGVQQRRLLAALDEVGVVARPVGKRDQGVEQAPVPIDGAQGVYPVGDLPRLHGIRSSSARAAASRPGPEALAGRGLRSGLSGPRPSLST